MDINHYFIEKGKGETIILLHGNGESSDYFQGQIDEFSKWYHVYAIDTRGHGKTPRGEKPFTIRQFADDLLCFMDEQKIEKSHLLGFSDGGNIAMVFAMKAAGRMKEINPQTEIRRYQGYAHAQLASFETDRWISEVSDFLL